MSFLNCNSEEEMTREWLKEPSAEDCSQNKMVYEDEYRVIFACWYPQMGGYVGKCVVDIGKGCNDGCFEAYIWHDGEFPFSDGDSHASPARIHHCMADQFVIFGNLIAEEQAKFACDEE